ncbi:glycosyltransferase [Pedobacter sp. UC225_61]|uniref:glycosyltransferase n=1 Tax=Pedobacter sp. UC225_61 TaxID=3374623 RepID=UPI0037BAFDE8
MEKKNIYILTLSMGSGGAEKVISLILPFLIQKYRITLVLFSNNIHFDIPRDVNLIILNNEKKQSFFAKIFSFPIAIRKYMQLLKKNKAAVSLSFLTRPNLINGFVKIFNPNIKVIISERCYPSIAYKSTKSRYLFYKILIPLFYNRADLLFSNSIHINTDLMENFKVSIPCKVIYNPIHISNNSNPTPANQIDSGIFKLINVGSIYPIKNQGLILRALQNANFKYQLDFVGDGVMENDMIEMAAEFKIDQHVNFLGRRTNVNDYLKQSDCFILSSNSEGFPNVVLEAMAVGLPIISTNCMSGPLEILNENSEVPIHTGSFFVAKYGILINVDDHLGLKAAIEYLIQNPEIRHKLSKLSLERAQEYRTEIIMEKLYEILD